MPQVRADLSDEAYESLIEIASRRGIDANTALQQAILTEKLISDNVKQGDDLIIKRRDKTTSKVEFS